MQKPTDLRRSKIKALITPLVTLSLLAMLAYQLATLIWHIIPTQASQSTLLTTGSDNASITTTDTNRFDESQSQALLQLIGSAKTSNQLGQANAHNQEDATLKNWQLIGTYIERQVTDNERLRPSNSPVLSTDQAIAIIRIGANSLVTSLNDNIYISTDGVPSIHNTNSSNNDNNHSDNKTPHDPARIYQVTQISSDSITLTHLGNTYQVTIVNESDNTKNPSFAPFNNQPRSLPNQANPSNAASFSQMSTKMHALIGHIQPVPDATSEAPVYQISVADNNPETIQLLRAMGLKNEDQILSINGLDITANNLSAIRTSIEKNKKISAKIKRNGTIREIMIPF